MYLLCVLKVNGGILLTLSIDSYFGKILNAVYQGEAKFQDSASCNFILPARVSEELDKIFFFTRIIE